MLFGGHLMRTLPWRIPTMFEQKALLHELANMSYRNLIEGGHLTDYAPFEM